MKSLILVGGGGHCRSCIEVIYATKAWKIQGILDKNSAQDLVPGVRVVGDDSQIEKYAQLGCEFLITVGQLKTAQARLELFEKIKSLGGVMAKVIAPTAIVSSYATIGAGTIIMHRAVINADAIIGQNCIINTGAIIEHQAIVGDHSHISVGAIIAGNVIVRQSCFIGCAATLLQGTEVCSDVCIGANSTVLHDVHEPGVYVGSPIRRLKMRTR